MTAVIAFCKDVILKLLQMLKSVKDIKGGKTTEMRFNSAEISNVYTTNSSTHGCSHRSPITF